MTTAPALALEHISKRFGEVTALEDVSLTIEAGQVHALLGENGAGKTTLMHVAFGMIAPDTGAIRVQGSARTIDSPANAIAAGIGMVHQHFTLVPTMTVAENLALGGRGLLRQRRLEADVRDVAAATGFALDPTAMVESLSVGAQQRVEIAKAIARQARVLILDEPTAVLAPGDAEELMRWTRRFADVGNAVVLITHKLNEALAVADHVTVLRRGRVAYSGAAAATNIRELTTAMIGHEPIASHETGAREAAPEGTTATRIAVLEAEHVTVLDAHSRPRLRDASLVVYGGEIVGVAGLEGAGQWELLRTLAGRIPVASGSVKRPADTGFVPEDRHRDAVLLDRSLIDNVALRDAGRRRGRMRWRSLDARTRSLVRDFDVRASSAESTMRTLSGGNQQKLVLAREMTPETSPAASPGPGASAPQALVIENPTRGLDVRATAEVHERLRAARASGVAIVLYSSDLDEVIAHATRIVVLHAGILREVPLDRDLVGRAMLGLA